MIFKIGLFLVFWLLWIKIILGLLNFGSPDYPFLRARFGTIMWHSNDKNGVYLGSYNDPDAVDHIYCYYPKALAHSKILIKRQDDGNCSNWYGKTIFREGSWISQLEKYDGL